jgi:hypothetical protein
MSGQLAVFITKTSLGGRMRAAVPILSSVLILLAREALGGSEEFMLTCLDEESPAFCECFLRELHNNFDEVEMEVFLGQDEASKRAARQKLDQDPAKAQRFQKKIDRITQSDPLLGCSKGR